MEEIRKVFQVRFHWYLFTVAAGLIVLVGAIELLVYSGNLRARHRAEALLRTVRVWHLNETTLSETEPVRSAYSATRAQGGLVTGADPEQTFAISVGSDFLKAERLEHPGLWSLGFRPSNVAVVMRYRNEKLVYLSYSLMSPVRGTDGAITELVAEARVHQDATPEPPRDYTVGYYLHPTPILPDAQEIDLVGAITPRAGNEEHMAIFDFDLSCMSSFVGCTSACQIMPSAWREAHRQLADREISAHYSYITGETACRHTR